MKELKYYGLYTCLAIWKTRPSDILRVYLEERHLKSLSPLLKWCAGQKKVYRLVSESELEKISTSMHHEGVCIVAKEPSFTQDPLQNPSPLLLYLDGVQNPHNLGSILRTAAHFGISAILGDAKSLPTLSPSCCRVAKGGSEFVRICPLEKPLVSLNILRKRGYKIITTCAHRGESLYKFNFPHKSILILGSESVGVDKSFLAAGDHQIVIPGTKKVDSLNVSVAAALSIGEYSRQHP